jgi:hypothetical protein
MGRLGAVYEHGDGQRLMPVCEVAQLAWADTVVPVDDEQVRREALHRAFGAAPVRGVAKACATVDLS